MDKHDDGGPAFPSNALNLSQQGSFGVMLTPQRHVAPNHKTSHLKALDIERSGRPCRM